MKSRLALSLFSILAYVLVFIPLYFLLSRAAVVLVIAPVVFIALLYGWQGGLLAGMIFFPLDAGLFCLFQDPSRTTFIGINYWVSHTAFLIFGILTGYIHGLKVKAEMEIRRRKKIEHDLKNSLQELQKALEEVKILSGMLPICSNCKKIRNDKGYWEQIECYIRDRSDAEFTHSLCPDCVKKIYPAYKDPSYTLKPPSTTEDIDVV